jgi:hypothetical protein
MSITGKEFPHALYHLLNFFEYLIRLFSSNTLASRRGEKKPYAHIGPMEYFLSIVHRGHRRNRYQQLAGMIKKVRPARPQYCLLRPVGRNCLAYPEGEYLCVDAQSVLPVREHGKVAKTLLAAFFNIPIFEEILVHKKSPQSPNGD